jgi:hypothetical protein
LLKCLCGTVLLTFALAACQPAKSFPSPEQQAAAAAKSDYVSLKLGEHGALGCKYLADHQKWRSLIGEWTTAEKFAKQKVSSGDCVNIPAGSIIVGEKSIDYTPCVRVVSDVQCYWMLISAKEASQLFYTASSGPRRK